MLYAPAPPSSLPSHSSAGSTVCSRCSSARPGPHSLPLPSAPVGKHALLSAARPFKPVVLLVAKTSSTPLTPATRLPLGSQKATFVSTPPPTKRIYKAHTPATAIGMSAIHAPTASQYSISRVNHLLSGLLPESRSMSAEHQPKMPAPLLPRAMHGSLTLRGKASGFCRCTLAVCVRLTLVDTNASLSGTVLQDV